MKLGSFEIEMIRDGVFKLDGGAMFGVVPRVLWEKLVTPDDQNRVTLGLNCLLVKTPDHNVLVEAGIGDALDEKGRRIYGIQGPPRLESELSRLGVGAQAIDYVVCTHLHFDHAGGCTKRREDGSFVPRFPRARYIVRKEESEDAQRPDPRSRPSYLAENIESLAGSEQLEVVDRECEVVPGVSLQLTGGHTRGHQVIVISSGDDTVCYLGDIIPTEYHVKPGYVASFDAFPLDTMKIRERVLSAALSHGWLLALPHSLETELWRVVERDGEVSLMRAGSGGMA